MRSTTSRSWRDELPVPRDGVRGFSRRAINVNTGPVSDASAFDTRTIGAAVAHAGFSESTVDEAWDRFLQDTPLGHFQQSAIWSEIKEGEGWRVARVVVRQGDVILGGFQILHRRRGIFREGFLNKGPVHRGNDAALLEWLMELIERTARKIRLLVLLAQAPDADTTVVPRQLARGYAANGLGHLITATLCVPLGAQLAPAETRMRKTIQQESRQAVRRGMSVREGSGADIPAFFEMMCITCRRQETQPTPATVEAMQQLWDGFHAKGLARLTLAEYEGRAVAGVFAIRFGQRVTQWKKGWNEEHRDKHPNTLLTFESIQWSEKNGAALYDFVGLDRGYARELLAGTAPKKGLLASRYFFLLGFAAEPHVLPLAYVWFPNPVARAMYRSALPLLRKSGRVQE